MCKRNTDPLPLTSPQPGTWPTTQACALTGVGSCNPSVRRPALHPLSHTSQGRALKDLISHFQGERRNGKSWDRGYFEREN